MNLKKKKNIENQIVKCQSISLFIAKVKYQSLLGNLEDQTVKSQNISLFIAALKYQCLLNCYDINLVILF
jgi:hypothetical protein